ncbi:hypothetical protein AAC387_Pa05g2265 [Persea americana]
MKGGKDEEKVMGPMFPRLHVSDTEKGGPRPPPRNKMALYERLSVPSRRFNSHTASAFPPRSNKTNTLVVSSSSSQGGSCERSVFSSFYIPPPTTHSTEKLHSHSSDQMNLNAMAIQLERNSMRKAGCKASDTTRNSSSTSQCSFSRTHNSSNSNNSCGKKIRYEDDFVVPTFVQSGISQGFNVNGHGGERSTPYSAYPTRSTAIEGNSPQKSMVVACNSSVLLQNTHDKPLKEIGTTDLKVRKQKRNLSEEKPKETVAIRDRFEKSGSQPLTGKLISKPSRHVSASLNQEHHSSPINELQSRQNKNSQLYLESAGLQQENNCIYENDVAERENASRVRSEWCSRDSLEKYPNQVENCVGGDEDNANESMLVGDQNDDITDTSMVDSISRFEVSPDDVVGVMGQKNFWDARREIANEQRVFAVQVFELH